MPQVTADAFMLPSYDVPDALPNEMVSNDREVVTEYKIPLVVWMFFFLFAGYVGLRLVLED